MINDTPFPDASGYPDDLPGLDAGGFDLGGGAEEPTPRPAAAAPSEPAAKPAAKSGALAWLAGGTLAVVALGFGAVHFLGGEASAAPGDTTGKATMGAAARPARSTKHLARVSAGGKTALIDYDQVAAEAMKRYAPEILEKVINRTVIEMACAQRGVRVTDAEVEAEINEFARKFDVDRNTWLQMLQAERGLTPQQYKHDVIWPMVALKKLAGTEVQITEKDIQKAFMRDYGPKVKARMIMVDDLRRAQQVALKAQAAPESFGDLARQFSIDPTSKSMDGVIPPISMYGAEEMREIEKAAFKLQDNAVSAVLQLPFPGMQRYVILKREGVTEPVVRNIEDVRATITENLREEMVQERVATVFKSLKEQTEVHNFLTNTTTGGVRKVGATR